MLMHCLRLKHLYKLDLYAQCSHLKLLEITIIFAQNKLKLLLFSRYVYNHRYTYMDLENIQIRQKYT